MGDDNSGMLVNARFLGQTITGVQRYAFELIRALDGLMDRVETAEYRKHPFVLLAPRRAKNRRLDLERISLKEVGRLDGVLWGQVELPYFARGKVLWSPTNTGPIYHGRHIVTIHDASVLDHPRWFSAKFAAWYRFLLPRLAKHAARILTVSEFSRGRLAERLALDPSLIHVVPGGVSPMFETVSPDVVDTARERLRLPNTYLLSLGSLEPRKNIARLLNAWELLLARGAVPEDVHLVVTGGKSSIYRDAGFSRLPDKVTLAGYVADEDLPALYSGALAFVYPSLYEGFGLPPLEAMACGTPVVASGSTSIPEVTGDAALLVDPFDVESIAGGIQSILDDVALRESLRAAGLVRAGLFGWDRSARLLWEHLVSMTGG